MLEQDIQQLTAAVKELTAAIREQQQAANLSEVTALRKDTVREPITINQEPVAPEPAPQPAPVKAEKPKEEPTPAPAPKPKAEEPTPEPEPAKPAKPAPEPTPEPKAEAAADVPDEELLKGLLKELYSKKGGDVVAETMNKFGVSRLGNVPLEQRAELKVAIEEALA